MSGVLSYLWIGWRKVTGRGSGGSGEKQQQQRPLGPGDVVIFIIGPTGSGKSTLINAILGAEKAEVGHGLSTCTERVEGFPFEIPTESPLYPGKTIVIADTPGFDDTAMNDSTRVFKDISQWVTEYPRANPGSKKPQVAGFIYLQDITQKRVNNRQNVDFQRLQQLAEGGGDKASSPYSNLVLATFQWPKNKESKAYAQAAEREKELETKFWKDLLGLGARMVRVEDPARDARSVVWEALKGAVNVEFPAPA